MHLGGATFFRHSGGGGEARKQLGSHVSHYPEAAGAFEDLLLLQDGISDKTMSSLERFVVLLYDQTNDITNVNDCRKHIVHTEVQNT